MEDEWQSCSACFFKRIHGFSKVSRMNMHLVFFFLHNICGERKTNMISREEPELRNNVELLGEFASRLHPVSKYR